MREKRTCTVPKHIVNGCNTKGNTEKRKKKKLKQNELNEMLNKAGKLRLKQCENKFRYQKLLNCLAHAKCLLMSCMFTDNLIYRYCHAMHPHTQLYTHTHVWWQLLEPNWRLARRVSRRKRLTFKGQVSAGILGQLPKFVVAGRGVCWSRSGGYRDFLLTSCMYTHSRKWMWKAHEEAAP